MAEQATYTPPAHRDYKRFSANWEEMRKWWTDFRTANNTVFAGNSGRDFIRECAERNLLIDLAGSGQGISSSDVRHRVFSIWQDWKDDQESERPASSCLSFLVRWNYENN